MPAEAMTGRIMELLRPQLGSPMVEQTQLCSRAAAILAQYGTGRDTLSEMRDAVESVLFDECYNALGETMHLRLDDGRDTRIWLHMLPGLADEAMGALFEMLPVYSANYRILMDYTVKTGSLSGMRVLYQQYRKFLSQEDASGIKRIIRERYPEERCRGWLAD